MADGRVTEKDAVSNRRGPQTRVPNLILRRFREEQRKETRREFAEAMTRKARELGKPIEPDENYVARLENGYIKYPGPPYRSVLVALCDKSMADLGFTKFFPPSSAVAIIRDSYEDTAAQGINEPLRAAIAARGMEIESFARLVDVHPKTVQRWLGGRIPHPRHRWKACDILQRSEQELWPTDALDTTNYGDQSPARLTTEADTQTDIISALISADGNPESLSQAGRTYFDRLTESLTTRVQEFVGDPSGRDAALDLRSAFGDLWRRTSRPESIARHSIADALGRYYSDPINGYGRYSARYGQTEEIVTSVLTHSDWLDLNCPLDPNHDRLTLVKASVNHDTPFDADAADAAAKRLAETLLTGTRLVDGPLYRLHEMDIGKGGISGSVEITTFARYALTMDLLEGELIDALTAGVLPRPGLLPLRDRYLPDLTNVLGIGGRLCAGGTLGLCAIARPASPYRGPADYLLLVQERSGDVLNAAGRLTVLPRGFHQPMTDFRADARIGATLRREMEEELFGREDIDNTLTEKYAAEPMHPTRLSEPAHWLMYNPDRARMECTAFGLNLVNGNCEFACLIVIDDENFWSRYGGRLVANWESSSLRQYSSLDSKSLTDLVQDPAWSNEGLFALLQGLRRLKEIGRSRVDLPAISWEIRQ
jgi:transcriptional regulator with XRE-family HTH domain